VRQDVVTAQRSQARILIGKGGEVIDWISKTAARELAVIFKRTVRLRLRVVFKEDKHNRRAQQHVDE
jgi:GTPase Era involved in 16S rRNA processing